MFHRPRFAVLALACVLGVAGCSEGNVADAGSPIAPQLETLGTDADGLIAVGDRQPLPQLSGETLDGEQLDLAAYRGKVVVLNFWASWCAPCRSEAQTLNEVANQTKADGVQFVGVNFKDELDSAQAFEREQKTPYPSLFDQPGRLLLNFRKVVPQTPPTTMIVDRQGRISAVFQGEVDILDLMGPVRQIAAEA